VKAPWRRLILAGTTILVGTTTVMAQDESLRLSDVVGKYWVSDGADRRWTVTIRKDGTFISNRFVGDVRSDSRQPREGVASVSNGHLGLVAPPGDEVFIFRPVRLGERLYLVPLGGELAFCIALAKGVEPRKSDVGDLLLRQGDERVPVPDGVVPPFCQAPGPSAVPFAHQSDAKRFIVDRVMRQAESEGVALTNAERHMLGWSESDPDFTPDLSLAEQLEQEQSDEEYERKVAALIRHAFERDGASDSEMRSRYRDAFNKLGEGDHYISIMMKDALGSKLRRGWFHWSG
jgi:hypothetical protein